MADWLKLFDPTSDSEPAQTPSQPEEPSWLRAFQPEEPSWLRAFTYEDFASPAPSREMAEPIANYFIDTLSPILGPVFDVLLRGQYGSARAFRGFAPDLFDPEARPTTLERIWGAAKGFWEGAVRGQPDSYQDIIREVAPNWPEWLKAAIGFGADIFLDPTTYIGIGAVGKSGQRSLLSFAGVDLVKGEKVFNTLQDAVNHLKKNTAAGRWLEKHFSTRRGITDEEFWNAYQAARSEAQYLVAKALESNIPLEQAVADIEKNLGIPRNVLTDLIERPVTTGEIIAEHTVKKGETVTQIAKTWNVDPDQIRQLNNLKKGARLKEGQVLKIPTIGEISRLEGYPQEAKNLVEQFQIIQQGRVQREMTEGIPIAPLESDVITYMGHYLTPEAREALEKAGIGKPGRRFSALIDQSVRHPSGQRRQIRDLTVAEINQLAREGEIIPGFKGNIFIEDPVLINVIRDTMHARTLAAAHFIRNVVDNPEWAAPLAEAPAGWRKLGPGAQYRFGDLVKERAFRPDIADALDEYVQKAFDPKAVDELIGLYDRWLNVWKAYTLGTRPRWMINNLMGNLWNGVVLGGATASDLTDAFKALVGGRGNIINHRVQPGETLTSISKQYGVSIDQIVRANNLANPDRIFAGEILVIPKGEATIAGYSAAELINLAERYGAIRKGLYGVEIGYRGGLPQLQGVTSQLQKPVRPLFAANQVIEDWTRLGLFINRIKNGDTPQQAAQYVKKYLFDYTDLTPTEQYVMKRIAPFYSWIRKNIPLQMEHLVTTPGKYSTIPKLMEATESLQEEPYPGVAMPEWMQRSLVLRIGDAGMPGTARFLSLTGHPAADLINLLADIASGEPPRTLLSSNPVIAALFALGGMDIYSGQEIPEGRLVSVLPGVTMSARHYTALENLFPPIDTISSLTVPYANPLIREPDPYHELKMWLFGYKTYDRHIDEDIMNLMEDLYRQQSLLEYQMTRSLLLGRDWEYEAYYKQYEELIDTVMTLTDALSRVPAKRTP